MNVCPPVHQVEAGAGPAAFGRCVAQADWEVHFRSTAQGSWAGWCASVTSLTARLPFLVISFCLCVWMSELPKPLPSLSSISVPIGLEVGDTYGRLLWNVSLYPPCLPSAAAPQSVGPPHLHCSSSALRNLWAPKGDPGSVISTQGSYLDVFFLPFPKPWSKYDMKIITVPAF